MSNKIPDIEIYEDEFKNPTIASPNTPFVCQFEQTRDSLMDVETYKNFLKSGIAQFRHSITYKHYKGFLFDLGLDHCQFHGNINNEMATIEMHHNMLTIFDIAVIITEHIINTVGHLTTFDLAALLREEHISNRVQLVMLSLTPHQLYHNNPEFFIHPDMCVGNWIEFLKRYNCGMTIDIAYKIITYLNKAIDKGSSDDSELLSLRDSLLNWSNINNF